MATFEYSVDGQSITTTKAGRLVSGTIGVNTVKFTFDSSWDGLEKWATFDPNPGKPYKQPLDANGECLIPGEVMGGITLRIGAFGLADGQAYPTVWANKLQMEEGCFIEVPVSDWPEPSPVIEEILEELENKVDKPENATEGNVAVIGSNGNIVDGGHSFSDAFPVGSASGSIVTIEDGADAIPVKSMTVQIEPVQAGTGDPSPSNVRAITGWTGATITQTDGDAVSNTYAVTFPTEAGTLYGGTVTVNEDGSGTLTVDRKGVNMSTLAWSGDSITTAHRMLVTISDRKYGSNSSGVTAISEQYAFYGNTTLSNLRSNVADLHFGFRDSNGQVLIRNNAYSDVDTFKASLNGVLMVYPLKTPVVYQLTAEEVISTLKGLNNIWADTGDIAVEYHADPTIYVSEKTKAIKQSIAPVEDGYTASQAYAVGAFLYVGDTLYKVTSAIASGATITPNTNCVATTVAEQLIALA